MKIYHVETQEAYDELMTELEEKGRKWLGGAKPTKLDKFKNYGKDTYIFDESGVLSFSNGYYFIAYYSDETLIEYKSKGENMTQEEMKQNIFDWARDVSVAVESFARGMYEAEADLQEAKSSAKKLIEKIDKYLKSVNPKFKKGDIVASKIFTDDSLSFIKLNQDLNNWCSSVDGFWYIKRDCKVYNRSLGVFKEDTRHATTEEIAEYEVALNFHKHGRKPFEVKEGDLIKYPNGQNIIIYHPDCFSKTDFLNDGFKLLKTAEEVSEWLENK